MAMENAFGLKQSGAKANVTVTMELGIGHM
jgi:hypothetical protein